jgi:branched-chain amino acid transport system ATP-binding protein
MLSVQHVCVSYGGVQALDRISFDVAGGEIVGIIGPNGAGKTTLFNCISGFSRPDQGDIALQGRSVLGLPAHAVAALGLGRTFQTATLFDGLTVRDNIKAGCHGQFSGGLVASALRLPRIRRAERLIQEQADALIEAFGLGPYAANPAPTLPLAIRKRVELARALAARPRLLLLDEPAAGLARQDVDDLADGIRQLPRTHAMTILLVEHHMGLVMSVSDRIVALDFGRKIAEGTPDEVRRHPDVLRAYLGSSVT